MNSPQETLAPRSLATDGNDVHGQFDLQLRTRELVVKYANELKSSGVEPTSSKILSMIRERVDRKASPNLVIDELRLYKEKAGRMAENVLKLEGIDEQYRETAISMLANLIQLSRQIAERDTAIYVEQANEKLEQMQQRVEVAERRREADQATIQAAGERIAESKVMVDGLSQQLSESKSHIDRLESEAQALQGEVRSLRALMDEQRQEFNERLDRVVEEGKAAVRDKSAEMQRLSEAHEVELQQMRDLVATQIDQLDAFRKAAAIETDRQRQSFAKDVESLKSQLTYESAKLGAASTEIKRLETELAKANGQKLAIEGELKAERNNSLSLKQLYDSLNAKLITAMAGAKAESTGTLQVSLDPYPLIDSSVFDDEYKQRLRVIVEEALEDNGDLEVEVFEKTQSIVKLGTKNMTRAMSVIDSIDKGDLALVSVSTRGW